MRRIILALVVVVSLSSCIFDYYEDPQIHISIANALDTTITIEMRVPNNDQVPKSTFVLSGGQQVDLLNVDGTIEDFLDQGIMVSIGKKQNRFINEVDSKSIVQEKFWKYNWEKVVFHRVCPEPVSRSL